MKVGRLQDKVALITGAACGIGRATALEFAREGADVIVQYLDDRAAADDACHEVEAVGRRADALLGDVNDEDQVAIMFDRAVETFGRVDILVNNAGVDVSGAHSADPTTQEWDRMLRTNFFGAYFCCRRFARLRATAGGGGTIINVTSVHEQTPNAGAGDHDYSKGALRTLTRTLAIELAPLRVNVNNLAPGSILTSITQAASDDPDGREARLDAIPQMRGVRLDEIARLAVFLASGEADYVTGFTYTYRQPADEKPEPPTLTVPYTRRQS